MSGDRAGTKQFDVGIAGAGQLARMTCLAAWPLGLRVGVLGQPGEPAVPMAAGLVEGDWQSAEDVARLGAVSGVVTLENEFVEASALAAVEAAGTPVRPGADALARVQDKALQKEMLRDAGLAVPRFMVAASADAAVAAGEQLGWPLMLKARKRGYDGYGNATCESTTDVGPAFERLDAGEGVLVEEWVPFVRELAVMIARRPSGESLAYPIVETRQSHHVCHEVLVPAPSEPAVIAAAGELAAAAAEAAEGLGVTGVEMFELEDGRVMVNELAPRPHNSGHYSIEACETSQFENHLRGVLDLPLGSVALRQPGAAMVNLLGTYEGPANPTIGAPLAIPKSHLHLYGKTDVRIRRKMGHVTALGPDADTALDIAERAAGEVGL